eukprot:scaffold1621_cov150-Pinguiococcus_pyrenoidosus.AAC.8
MAQTHLHLSVARERFVVDHGCCRWRGRKKDEWLGRAGPGGSHSRDAPESLAASLPRCLVASLPCCLAASLPRCLAASLPRCLADSLTRCLADSLSRFANASWVRMPPGRRHKSSPSMESRGRAIVRPAGPLRPHGALSPAPFNEFSRLLQQRPIPGDLVQPFRDLVDLRLLVRSLLVIRVHQHFREHVERGVRHQLALENLLHSVVDPLPHKVWVLCQRLLGVHGDVVA